MAPRHKASASVPLHASVASTGTAGVPNSLIASPLWTRVNGRTTCASTHVRRSRPKKPRLPARARSTNLTAFVWGRTRSVSTRDLPDRHVGGAERPPELRDGGQTLEPGRTRKDIDVDGARLGPGVKDRVRLGQDQDAGQP